MEGVSQDHGFTLGILRSHWSIDLDRMIVRVGTNARGEQTDIEDSRQHGQPWPTPHSCNGWPMLDHVLRIRANLPQACLGKAANKKSVHYGLDLLFGSKPPSTILVSCFLGDLIFCSSVIISVYWYHTLLEWPKVLRKCLPLWNRVVFYFDGHNNPWLLSWSISFSLTNCTKLAQFLVISQLWGHFSLSLAEHRTIRFISKKLDQSRV